MPGDKTDSADSNSDYRNTKKLFISRTLEIWQLEKIWHLHDVCTK